MITRALQTLLAAAVLSAPAALSGEDAGAEAPAPAPPPAAAAEPEAAEAAPPPEPAEAAAPAEAPKPPAASADMQWAEENLRAGRYADAVKNLEAVLAAGAEAEKPRARRLLAETMLLTGRYDDVGKLLAEVKEPSAAETLLAGRALAARGRHQQAVPLLVKAAGAEGAPAAALGARAELIEIYDRLGQRDKADELRELAARTYQKSGQIRYTREGQEVADPEELLALARCLSRRDPQGAINALTSAQRLDQRRAEPYVLSCFLFMEKYNWGEAGKELASALRINKRHPLVQLAAARHAWATRQDAKAVEQAVEQALEANPNLTGARALLAAVQLFDDEHDKAREQLDAALAVDPSDPEALALLAAWHLDLGRRGDFEAACGRALAVNPRDAAFYATIAGVCERKRRFPDAAGFYQKAIDADPQDWRGHYGLGMALTRQGRDAEGKRLLEKAFALNKYNLFCRNMLVVLDKLVPPEGQEPQFQSLQTDHFVIRAPREDAPALLPYYARELEETYARYQAKYGFEPQGPIVVEVFNRHGDFSARTAGLPGIGADGACFGQLITLDTPRVWQAGSVPKFNWAVVADHELMHVFSLQQTDYRISRWLTEGLSVYEEPAPRVELERMFVTALASGGIIKVKDLNRQMSRPTAPANGLLAYYQAARIVEGLYARHGAEGMAKLLAEVKACRTTDEAIAKALGQSPEQFEAAVMEYYRAYAAEKVRMPPQYDAAQVTRFALEARNRPEDPAPLADLGWAYLQARRFDLARKYAGQSLEKGAQGPVAGKAHTVLGAADFEDKQKNYRRAREHFAQAVAAAPDSFQANFYMGRLCSKEGLWKEAVERLEAAIALYPHCIFKDGPYDELGKVYDLMGEKGKALEVLRRRVTFDKLGYEPAEKLARLALAAGQPEAAAWGAWRAVRVDPFQAGPHNSWGRAALESGDAATAEREFRLAARCDAADADARAGLARALLALGRKDQALESALEAKALMPGRPDLEKLVKELEAAGAKLPVAPPPPPPDAGPAPEAPPPPAAGEEPAPAPAPPLPREIPEAPKLEKIEA